MLGAGTVCLMSRIGIGSQPDALKTSHFVVPAQAGTQRRSITKSLDSRLRGNDG